MRVALLAVRSRRVALRRPASAIVVAASPPTGCTECATVKRREPPAAGERSSLDRGPTRAAPVPDRRGRRHVVRQDHRRRATGRADRRATPRPDQARLVLRRPSRRCRSRSGRRSTTTIPDAFDWALLNDHLAALTAGAPVRSRSTTTPFDRTARSRGRDRGTDHRRRGHPRAVGAVAARPLRPQGVLDAAADLRLIRRLPRDVDERGRTTQSVIEQYLRTVRPRTSSSSSRASATPT